MSSCRGWFCRAVFSFFFEAQIPALQPCQVLSWPSSEPRIRWSVQMCTPLGIFSSWVCGFAGVENRKWGLESAACRRLPTAYPRHFTVAEAQDCATSMVGGCLLVQHGRCCARWDRIAQPCPKSTAGRSVSSWLKWQSFVLLELETESIQINDWRGQT